MKKFILLVSFAFACQNQLTAQIIGPVKETYNVTVIRQDDYNNSTQPGYAPTTITLDMRIASSPQSGPTPQSKPFGANNNSPQIYTFPLYVFSLPGSPPNIKYVRVSSNDVIFSNPQLISGYYPLSTVVGSHTTISDPYMIAYNPPPGQYGYGVDLYCTAPNQYTMRVTKFLCHICVPPDTPVSKVTNPQNDVTLVPNPSMGFSELQYKASGKETISINVADMNGRIVRAYTIDIEAGLNKLPIDLQNQLGGNLHRSMEVQCRNKRKSKTNEKIISIACILFQAPAFLQEFFNIY